MYRIHWNEETAAQLCRLLSQAAQRLDDIRSQLPAIPMNISPLDDQLTSARNEMLLLEDTMEQLSQQAKTAGSTLLQAERLLQQDALCIAQAASIVFPVLPTGLVPYRIPTQVDWPQALVPIAPSLTNITIAGQTPPETVYTIPTEAWAAYSSEHFLPLAPMR